MCGPSFDSPILSLTNFTGHPYLVMPAGFEQRKSRALFGHPENDTDPTLFRVPRSISLWSSLFQEEKLVHVGRDLEALLAMSGDRPPAFA